MNRLNAKTNAERRPSSWPKLNQLLFDLGSDTDKEEGVNYIMQKIAELDKQFDLGSYLFRINSLYSINLFHNLIVLDSTIID